MRHPLVFLVEAADDICYQIMDIEDAYKLRILSLKQTTDLLMRFIPTAKHDYTQKICQLVSDPNEQVAYLRSATIGNLIEACSNTFLEHEEEILSGKLHTPLIKLIPEHLKEAYEECVNTAVASIYCAPMVLDIELAGYKIISTLLEELTLAITSPNSNYSKQLLKRIPSQYEITSPDMYGRVQAILDYISGMTDIYALDLYRKITGMSLPSL
jgi:dGTPase